MFAVVALFAFFTLIATIFTACVLAEDNFRNEHYKFHLACHIAVCGYVVVTCFFMGSELAGPPKPDLSVDIRELRDDVMTLMS